MDVIMSGVCICGLCGLLFSLISCLLFVLYSIVPHKVIEKACMIGFIIAICCLVVAAILGLIGFIEIIANYLWAM